MADKTGIEWSDATWNPTTGCHKASQGCKHCYAERDWARLAHLPAYKGRAFTDVACHPERLDQPLRWKKPRKIFVNSMSDLFHEDVPFEFIDQVFAVMALAKQHIFQVLTKRPARMLEYMKRLGQSAATLDGAARALGYTFKFHGKYLVSWPIPNIWLGVSVEDQAAADERIPLLLQTPAAVRWISAEPLLGPVDMHGLWSMHTGRKAIGGPIPPDYYSFINWVVVGGESGSKARPTHPDWARSLRDQCAAAGVPYLFKQWGEWLPMCQQERSKDFPGIVADGANGCPSGGWPASHVHEWPGATDSYRVGRKAAGRLLDGVQHDGYPA